jgi:hypothetical protein
VTLQVVGAGVGRTGTQSLKYALERLLGAPCYHMMEVVAHPEHIEMWQRAVDGEAVDWDALFADYRAGVDWPAVGFWRELSAAYPESIVLLSVRDTDGWWRSADQTIFEMARRPPPDDDPVFTPLARMVDDVLGRFSPDWSDEVAAKAAFERHNDDVRRAVPGDRLVEWRPGDGWEPICAALGLAVPDEPFPRFNTTEDFRAVVGLDAPG